LSQHELDLKRGRYKKEEARKKATNQEKKRREEKGETVSPETSDMPPFSQFERSSPGSSEGSVVGPSGADSGSDSSDDDGGNDPAGEGVAPHIEDPGTQEPIDSPDATSSASDPFDPTGKRAREEVPASEEEPSDKRIRTEVPAQGSTSGERTGADDEPPSPFVCNL
jgi:hypothetical protein